jgi:hypothetical protein
MLGRWQEQLRFAGALQALGSSLGESLGSLFSHAKFLVAEKYSLFQ